MSESEQTRTEEFMQTLANGIDAVLKDQLNGGPYAFTLLLWPAKDGQRANYVSNADRAEIITALRETADRLEKKLDRPPHWEKQRH
jgi:hypothetical protein